MTTRPFLAFACAHMTDERLYTHQVAALSATHDCRVFVFREHDTMGGMAHDILQNCPAQFTLIGLSLGGYAAFEVIRQALPRLERLVLMDTTAVADHPARRQGRLQDIAKVQQGGIDALVPELPSRWDSWPWSLRPAPPRSDRPSACRASWASRSRPSSTRSGCSGWSPGRATRASAA